MAHTRTLRPANALEIDGFESWLRWL
jgi:hypothetical protein